MKKVQVEETDNSNEEVNQAVHQSSQHKQENSSSDIKQEASIVSPEAVKPEVENVLAELTNDLQRTRADFENFRKQVEMQKTQAMATAKYATVMKFLPLVDDFERAIATYPEQLSPLAKSFQKTLSNLGLSQIDSEPNAEFNPDFHEAISIEDDGEGEREVIAETLRPGYLYDGVVIRAAMVKVKRA